jgi:5-methylcytosine-specific restriction enzyme A
MKLCTVCGVVTSHPGSRCTTHARQSNRSRHNALYSTREWQRLSARVLRAWLGQHGSWCSGYQRGGHLAGDLTVDHVVPLAAGGAPFDIANCGVLCRSCNSTKGDGSRPRGRRAGWRWWPVGRSARHVGQRGRPRANVGASDDQPVGYRGGGRRSPQTARC